MRNIVFLSLFFLFAAIPATAFFSADKFGIGAFGEGGSGSGGGGGPSADALLLDDGTSYLLLDDGTSFLLL